MRKKTRNILHTVYTVLAVFFIVMGVVTIINGDWAFAVACFAFSCSMSNGGSIVDLTYLHDLLLQEVIVTSAIAGATAGKVEEEMLYKKIYEHEKDKKKGKKNAVRPN